MLMLICPPKIQPAKSHVLGLLYRGPEEKMHAAEAIEVRILSSIFVHQGIFVTNGHHCGDGRSVFGRQPNLRIFAKALSKVGEPLTGLRRQMVLCPSSFLQLIKGSQEFRTGAFRVLEAFSPGAKDFSLGRVLVKVAKKAAETRG